MERQAVAKTKTPTRAANHQRQSTGPSAPARSLVGLQSVIGNQAMRRLIDSSYIQTKLEISKPGDPFEQEADRVADSVMRSVDTGAGKQNASAVQTQVLKPQITRVIQRRTPPVAVREDDEEREEDQPVVQAKSLLGGPIQRACTDCEEEKQDTEVNPMVHRAAA